MPVKWSKSVVPTVMCDALLSEWALQTYCETPEAQKIVNEQGIEFSNVEVLKVEFKNILKISNLWDFKALKKLVLSNNCIEKIEGLSNLINLTKLDLSFNNIEIIAGLDNLKNLTDLNLAHNKISKLENLDTLRNLQILVLNGNQIQDFVGIQKLHGFRSIRSVSFNANPITNDADYKMKVIAYMPSLCYLDFRLISADMKKEGLDKYKQDVEELEEKVKQHEKSEKEKISKAEAEAFYAQALVDGLNEHQFLEEFLLCHEHSNLLFTFSPFADVFNEFASTFRNMCNDCVEVGVSEHNRRKNEVSAFVSHAQQLIAETLCNERKVVFEFLEFKEHVLLKLVLHDPSNKLELIENQKLIKTFNSKVQSLWRTLMTFEICLAEHLLDMHRLFCISVTEVVEEFMSKVKSYISQFQQLNAQLTDHATEFYSDWCAKSFDEKLQVIKTVGSDSGGLEAKLIELLKSDFDTLQTCLRKGYDARSAVLNEKEVPIISKLTDWLICVINRTNEVELQRHRQRIIEIIQHCNTANKELEVICKHADLPE